MARQAKERSALEISRLSKRGLHFVGGVSGLALQVAGDARSWILRATVAGKRRDIGLGGYPTVTLAGAREAARKIRAQIREGIDPVDDAKARRSALIAARAAALTFSDAASQFIGAKEAEWSNSKHALQWRATLETYAMPVIGKMLIGSVKTEHILRILEPIWLTKNETASRLRGRLESVLDWATARGYRKGDNPARWRGHLDMLLASPKKIQKVIHHAAMPYQELGLFLESLRKQASTGANALEFTILTAARSGEVRGATWSEIDLQNAVWTIPASRMKAKKEHRVPLSPAALAVLSRLSRSDDDKLVFPSSRNTALSDMTLTAVLRRMNITYTVHGFRSSFRDWCAERTNFPREVAEMALAHIPQNKVEAAYFRSDLFERRRLLMAEWSKFCDSPMKTAPISTIHPKVKK